MSIDPIRLLAALHPGDGTGPEGFVVLGLDALSDNKPSRPGFYRTAARGLEYAQKLDSGGKYRGVFHLVPDLAGPPAAGSRGKEVDAAACRAVWIDMDAIDLPPLAERVSALQLGPEKVEKKAAKQRAWKESSAEEKTAAKDAARKIIADAVEGDRVPPPSAIVDSGRGWHFYWLLSEAAVGPEALALVKGCNISLARSLDADACFDLARVLRTPGTTHRKDPDAPIPCELVEFHDDRRYTLESLVAKLGATPIAMGTSASTKGTPAAKRGQGQSATPLFVGGGAGIGVPELWWKFMGRSTTAQATWAGQRGDLPDSSRSGYAYALISLAIVGAELRVADDILAVVSAAPSTAGWVAEKGERAKKDIEKQLTTAPMPRAEKSKAKRKEKNREYASEPTTTTASVATGEKSATSAATPLPAPATGAATSALPTLPALNTGAELRELIPAIWKQIATANNPPTLFRFADKFSRISIDPDSRRASNTVLKADHAYGIVFRSARWYKVSAKGDMSPGHPVIATAKDMVANPDPCLPVLDGLAETPRYDENFNLVSEPGYSKTSRLFYAPPAGFSLPAIPDAPTKADCDAARQLFRDLLCDFPFKADSDETHAVAAFLSPFVRYGIKGATPLYVFEASRQGSGKSLLASLVHQVATGRDFDATTTAETEDEMRKKITSALYSSPTTMIFDNVVNLPFESLAAAVTSVLWRDRRLGKNDEEIVVPNRATWIITANNPAVATDIARRGIRVRLEPAEQRPETRTGWKIGDIGEHVRIHRVKYIAAAITLVRAWILAGKPKPTKILGGGFEDWSRVVGGILQFAGFDGFLDDREEFLDRVNPVESEWLEFVQIWEFEANQIPQKASELATLAERHQQLGSLFGEALNETKRARDTKLGLELRRREGQVYEVRSNDQLRGKFALARLYDRAVKQTQWLLMKVKDGCKAVRNANKPEQEQSKVPEVPAKVPGRETAPGANSGTSGDYGNLSLPPHIHAHAPAHTPTHVSGLAPPPDDTGGSGDQAVGGSPDRNLSEVGSGYGAHVTGARVTAHTTLRRDLGGFAMDPDEYVDEERAAIAEDDSDAAESATSGAVSANEGSQEIARNPSAGSPTGGDS